jgi:hypothetical protein
MHKKIEAELVSLAHSILEMKNGDNVNALHQKAREICEKLSVLKFVEAYVNETEQVVDNVEDTLVVKEEVSIEPIHEEEEKTIIVEKEIENVEIPKEDVEEEVFEIEKSFEENVTNEVLTSKNTLEEELKEAISADVATQMFEKATIKSPVVNEPTETKQRSLNDSIFKNNLQIGLNDRIAFVKHLFEGNQEDFNRVLSQLNSFKTEGEAIEFIKNFVKPDYNWSESEDYEVRLLKLIERKFS